MIGSATRPPTAPPAYVRLSDDLRHLILSGRLRPGDRLPDPDAIAGQHGVGRSTIREAFRRLEAEHLVVTTRGVSGGTFVSRPDPSSIAEALAGGLHFLVGADNLGVDELLEARALLEVPATALVAERASPEALTRIAAAIPTGALADPFAANRAFHTALLDATGNRLLGAMTMPIFEVLRSRFQRDTGDDVWGRVTDEHRLIHAALADGDAPGAADLMRVHLAGLRPIYRRLEVG